MKQQSVGLTRQQKVERMEYRTMQATTTAANIFSADVPQARKRYVVGLLISNQSASPVDLDVNKVDVDNNSDEFLDQLVIDADGQWPSTDWPVDIDNPLIILTGSQNLEFDVATSGTLEITIWYYDDPRDS